MNHRDLKKKMAELVKGQDVAKMQALLQTTTPDYRRQRVSEAVLNGDLDTAFEFLLLEKVSGED